MFKQNHSFIILALFVFSQIAAALKVESTSMLAVYKYLQPDSVIVFDLDNTVIEAKQSLGSDQYFSFLVGIGKKRGMTGDLLIDWALNQATPVQPKTSVQAVESYVPQLIADLQARGHTVFALTARPGNWAKGTLKQLTSIDVNFAKNAPQLAPNFDGVDEYRSGVIFVKNGYKKGPVLVSFLKESDLRSKPIVFVDDKSNNVDSVEEALEAAAVEHHVGIRYGAADTRVSGFSELIALCELYIYQSSKIFISDYEAQQKLMDGTCQTEFQEFH